MVERKWKPILKRAKKEGINKVADSVTGKDLFWCIDWFIRKGTNVVNGKIIDCERHAYFPEETPKEEWTIEVKIMTSMDPNPPPFEKGM
ncbi:hypothetical protein N0V84_000390 [Fusarium piperis]|uniref:Uncharacterized protein n=1 Tax=Fusarium piperis TaxID=1435070 RepID=A0A9W8WNQ1_9HYPO|nr:hypothetical protein N0V84_000390 [Fusarium piperis]